MARGGQAGGADAFCWERVTGVSAFCWWRPTPPDDGADLSQRKRATAMPEPVTTAILAALAVAGSEMVKLAVGEAYAGLRSLVVRKLGGGSKGVEALTKLEEDPTSAGWKETTVKELAKAGVDQD